MPSEKLFCLQNEGRNSQVDSGAFIQPYGAIFSSLISDLVFFIVSKADKMHGTGEDEDLTQLVNIFFHSPPSLPSFLALSRCSLEYQYMRHQDLLSQSPCMVEVGICGIRRLRP